ncbi:MAG: hypothetical protein ACLUIX_06135 [Oscillospiraceae bacterium]
MACYIFGAGDFDGLEEQPGAEDYVIAADGGYTACRRAGVEPQLLLGDFDSLAEVPALPHVERVPVEKDDTDMMLAIKRGWSEARYCSISTAAWEAGGRITPWPTFRRFCIWRITGPKAGSTDGASGGPPSGTAASCFRPVRRVFCRFSAWGRTLRASPSGGRSTRWRGRP